MSHRNEALSANKLTFTVVFETAEEVGYIVSFPAIPNLMTPGETLGEARAMAEDCLQGYLETLAERGLPLPQGETHELEPTIREAVTVHLNTAGAVVCPALRPVR